MATRRGKPPHPTVLKFNKGTLRKSRENPDEPKAPATEPRRPAWLGEYGLEFFRDQVEHLRSLGLLAGCDEVTLWMASSAYQEFREADAVLQVEGQTMTIETKTGEYCQQRPEVAIRKHARSEVARLMGLFGLNPSDRTRVKANPDAGKKGALEELKAKKAARLAREKGRAG